MSVVHSIGPAKFVEWVKGKLQICKTNLDNKTKVVEIKDLNKSFLIFDVCDQFDIRCPLIGELK